MAFPEEAPSVGADARTVHVVRVPGPDGDESLGVQGEGGMEGWGVVEAEVCPVPVKDDGGCFGGFHGGLGIFEGELGIKWVETVGLKRYNMRIVRCCLVWFLEYLGLRECMTSVV